MVIVAVPTFVLLLFVAFSAAVVIVLVLGAKKYSELVERDNKNYDKRVISSYVAAKIRSNDEKDGVKIGGFNNPDKKDEIETLYLYKTIDGEKYVSKIYCYDGYIYELYTLEELEKGLKPSSGNKLMEAGSLKFKRLGKEGRIIKIHAVNKAGLEDDITLSLRSREG